MVIQSMIFILGLLILLPSTGLLVKLSKLLANKLRISPLITGITIVALGTSLPELAVSATASISNDYGLAIGNIIGSNISNVLLVLPVGILIGRLRIGTTKTQRTIIALTVISVVFLILYIFKVSSFFSGILLIGLGVLVTLLEYKWGVEGGSHEDAFWVHKQQNESKDFTLISLLTLFLSLIGIMLGGILIVKSTEKLSELSGYSTAILGLSLTAIATSLPELLTTIFSQNENEEKLTLGNIIGSNIYNLTIVGGISAFFSQAVNLFVTDWIWFAFATLTIFSIVKIFKNITVPKSVGVILLLLMGLYLYSLTLVRV